MKYKIISINEYNLEIEKSVLKNLSPSDKEKYDRLSGNRKKHFILARYLLMQSGVDIRKIKYLGRKPVTDNLYFSISHSYDYTVVIVSNECVGIDIEKIREISPSVKETLMNKDIGDEEFLKHFTKMESYIKYNHLGLKNLKDDISDYNFEINYYNGYIITICTK